MHCVIAGAPSAVMTAERMVEVWSFNRSSPRKRDPGQPIAMPEIVALDSRFRGNERSVRLVMPFFQTRAFCFFFFFSFGSGHSTTSCESSSTRETRRRLRNASGGATGRCGDVSRSTSS